MHIMVLLNDAGIVDFLWVTVGDVIATGRLPAGF